jgi:hypothetical protein
MYICVQIAPKAITAALNAIIAVPMGASFAIVSQKVKLLMHSVIA